VPTDEVRSVPRVELAGVLDPLRVDVDAEGDHAGSGGGQPLQQGAVAAAEIDDVAPALAERGHARFDDRPVGVVHGADGAEAVVRGVPPGPGTETDRVPEATAEPSAAAKP